MSSHYVLDGHEPIPCGLMEWADWFETAEDRHVAKTERDGVKVSTVFLGIDHGFGGHPLLFETMVFGGEHNHHQARYSTWKEAEEGHEAICRMVWGEGQEIRPMGNEAEGQERSMCDIDCPKCGKRFALRWDPPSGVPETLLISACTSAGVYHVEIKYPHCGNEEEIES